MGVDVPRFARIEFPLDILGQARDTVCMLPRAREAEAERLPGRRVPRHGGRKWGVRNLEPFKTDSAFRGRTGLGVC